MKFINIYFIFCIITFCSSMLGKNEETLFPAKQRLQMIDQILKNINEAMQAKDQTRNQLEELVDNLIRNRDQFIDYAALAKCSNKKFTLNFDPKINYKTPFYQSLYGVTAKKYSQNELDCFALLKEKAKDDFDLWEPLNWSDEDRELIIEIEIKYPNLIILN